MLGTCWPTSTEATKGLEDRKFLKEVMQSGGHRGGLLACEIAEKALLARGLQE